MIGRIRRCTCVTQLDEGNLSYELGTRAFWRVHESNAKAATRKPQFSFKLQIRPYLTKTTVDQCMKRFRNLQTIDLFLRY